MNILWASSEVTPYAKTGGLADVSGSLPEALAKRGHNVTVIMPWYQQVTGKKHHLTFDRTYDNLKVMLGSQEEWAQVRELCLRENLRILFVEFNRFFDRPTLYDWNGREYDDNARRFVFFSRAVMECAVHLNLNPDILHANDWHTALCCVYLKSHLYRHLLPRCASVLTIHNIGYQGRFSKEELYWTGLGWEYFNSGCLEYYDSLNLLKGGIMTADFVSTVSPTYAKEILTPGFAFGMDGALQYIASRGRLRGILNGIDDDAWDPSRDKLLPARYTPEDLSGKALCKEALQKQFGLAVRKDLPVFSVISRLAEQKGLDVYAEALERLLPCGKMQAVVLTGGDPGLQRRYESLAARFPGTLAVRIGMAAEAEVHLAEAGADIFVMPSRYEPCGLNQMYSMRCGTLPLVRRTGGLADTVFNCDPGALDRSTGFTFFELNGSALANTMLWAIDIWNKHPDWIDRMRKNGMKQDFSWNRTAGDYEEMYTHAHQ